MQDNGALASFNISNNYRSGYGDGRGSQEFIRPIANVLKTNTSITEINLSQNELNAEAAKVLSDGIKDANGALASLDVSNNRIDENQKAKIKQICASKSIKCTL